MTLEILESEDFPEPECVCCPVRDVCETPVGVTVRITKDIRNRSGCDGASFETWDTIREMP